MLAIVLILNFHSTYQILDFTLRHSWTTLDIARLNAKVLLLRVDRSLFGNWSFFRIVELLHFLVFI